MAIIYASNPSYAVVSATISAAAAGDTVIIPEGAATWASRLHITKSIFLIGAGIGKTVIMNGYSKQSGASMDAVNNFITYEPANPASNPPFRLSGMTLNIGSSSFGILLRNASNYDCTKIRLDHLKAEANGFVFQRYGLMHGVADNVEFKGLMDIAGPPSLWSNNGYEFGTESNFYIEDSTWGPINDSSEVFHAGNGPARYAFRYCRITAPKNVQVFPMLDQHGNQPSAYSCMGAEVYENDFVFDGNSWGSLMVDQRGGKWLFYNNRVSIVNSGGAVMRLREEHQDSGNPPAVNPINGQPQHISSTYYFGNRKGGALFNPEVGETLLCSTCNKTVPTADQDFWVEKTPFTGASGIGIGAFSARPMSGLKPGVGYWDPATKTLYRAVNPTTWEAFYKPYAYPHPLRAEEGGPIMAKTIQVQLVVTAASDFFLSVAPVSLEIHPGNTATFTISVTGAGGFNKQLKFTAAGLPAGCAATFAPDTIGAGQSTVLTITTPPALALGNYTITVTATEQ